MSSSFADLAKLRFSALALEKYQHMLMTTQQEKRSKQN